MRMILTAALVAGCLMGGCGRSLKLSDLKPQILQDLRSEGDRIYSFKLAGFGSAGQREWELYGNRAQLIAHLIYLTDVISIAYGEEETVRVRSDRGTFDRSQSVATMEDNVVSTIEPKSHASQAKGSTVVTCTGPLDVDLEKKIAVFHDNVVVTDQEGKIFSDLLEVYFGEAQPQATQVATVSSETSAVGGTGPAAGPSRRVTKMIAKQNVKILQEGKVTYCDQATYTLSDRKVKIEGNPRVELSESAISQE